MRDLSRYVLLTLSIFALAFAACGDDDDDPDGQGGTGGVGGTGGDGGTGGVGGTGGTGGTGGVGGVGGTGGTGGTISSPACDDACENLVVCEEYETVASCRASICNNVDDTQLGCLAEAECTNQGLFGCVTASTECTAACDHAYNDCELAFPDEDTGGPLSVTDCGKLCTLFFGTEVATCMSAATCEPDDVNACINGG